MDERFGFLSGHSLAVYSSHGCPDCTRLDRWMAQHALPHTKVFIDEEPGAAEKLEAETGKQAVPFVLVDGRTWVRGYHKEIRGRFDEGVFLDELRQALAALPG
ncbi:MAG: glutaredoxin family protein [Planctomycetes bacterium]|nr:glutaredoxin family protein [Planctomycetota bacterium]